MAQGDASVAFLKESFRRYYEKEGPLLPDRFGRREWGFIPFGGGIIQRHLAFATGQEVREYLAERAPAHAYHSAAYYEEPGAPTMAEKGWKGADLIFDLDADHIPRAKEMDYPEMLAAVKVLFTRLVDDFLMGDLGIEEKSIKIAFSGARGYHAHVTQQGLVELESHERREIVDYITGTDLDLDRLIREKPIDSRGTPRFEKVINRVALPRITDPGWAGRFNKAVVRFFEELGRKPREQSLAELTKIEGVGQTRAESLLKIANSPQKLENLRQGFLEQDADIPRQLLVAIATKAGISLAGHTDEPVTSDIKRLIRLMGSLHGKTGLRVTPLTRDQLDEFDPLRDAVPSTFREDPVHVQLKKAIQLDIKGEGFKLEQGPQRVPEHVAIFLISRGMATLA